MSQQNSTVNFVIHGANGQPQMVKVVQNTVNETNTPIKLKQNPVKIVKLPAAVGNKPAVYKAVKLSNIKCTSKLVHLPVEAISRIQQVPIKSEPAEVENTEDLLEDSNQSFLEEATAVETVTRRSRHEEPGVSGSGFASRAAMSVNTRRRPHPETSDAQPEYTTKRRKHADKVGKGLRHFSMKVCEKVRTKGFTSYNEVADELVAEFAAGIHGSADSQQYDQKNIRRRVYDALNVLMAMNIISKEKKEIRWLGLPTNSIQECSTLEKEKHFKLDRIQKKTQQLQELLMQHVSFKSLIERNKEAENRGVKPSPSSAIHLPFIVVNTSDKALIDCSISNDKTEYMFNFNKRFQIHDDIDILKRMGLLYGLDKGECSEADLAKLKGMVPRSLEHYVEMMGRGEPLNISSVLDNENIDDDDQETEMRFKVEALEEEEEEEEEGEGAEGEEGEGDESSDGSDVDV